VEDRAYGIATASFFNVNPEQSELFSMMPMLLNYLLIAADRADATQS
jgi:hypothetical protein